MDDASQTVRAIIPEDPRKQLILPAEMVRRGLELASRIEQKQGILPFSEKPSGKEHIVRCYLEPMAWVLQGDGSFKLGVSDRSITEAPIYFVVSLEMQGVHLACTGKHLNYAGMEGNEDRYRLLNALHDLNPFTIPFRSLDLFYSLTNLIRESPLSPSGPLSHLPKDALKNFRVRIGPRVQQPGYKGCATREANPYFDINRTCVETVLVYYPTLGELTREQGLLAEEPPLKLTFVEIDQNGNEDPVASRDLYHAILEAKKPDAAQGIYASLEELYQNVPAGASQQKDWQQWELAYEGKYVRAKGRFDGCSLHPREGKLFFIVTSPGESDVLASQKKHVALWVEDAHQIIFGEKEGSFLLENGKWILLGEVYAFKGRVHKFSRFDAQLGSTDYKNVVILKARINDIGEG